VTATDALALHRGLDPDAPRHLTHSVVLDGATATATDAVARRRGAHVTAAGNGPGPLPGPQGES